VTEIPRGVSDRAVSHVLLSTLRNMRRRGSIVSEDGRLYVKRDLKQIKAAPHDQILTTPETNKRLAAEIELLRDLRPILNQLDQPHFKLPLKTRRKLKTWLEAVLIQRPPMSRDSA
jgi:hypothetical protein